jgi:hypothetical protein
VSSTEPNPTTDANPNTDILEAIKEMFAQKFYVR